MSLFFRRAAPLVACCVVLSACGSSGSDADPATANAVSGAAATVNSGATTAATGNTTSANTGAASGSSATASSSGGAGSGSASSSTSAALALNGTPVESIKAGSRYSFQPQASGSSAGTVTFNIENKPSWATFDSGTGLLLGTPANTNAGTYDNVLISASDGTQSVALNPFSITVATVASDTNAAPAYAAAVGYKTNTFSANFTNATVDTTNSGKSGFQWYPYTLFSSHPNLAAIGLNKDSSVTLAGDVTGPNGEITSAMPAKNSAGFVGTAFGGGAYIEAVFKFNPNSVAAAKLKGWPSFWSLAAEGSVVGNGSNQWKGQVKGYSHQIEYDFFEYDYLSNGAASNIYSSAMHDWYGIYKTTCAGGYCQQATPTAVNKRAAPTNTDFTQYHRYGFLWVPATATTEGYARAYFDGEPIGTDVRWTQYSSQFPTPNGQSWAYGIMDQQHLILIFGTGLNEPMTVESVNVWQTSSANNLHQ